MRSPCENPPDPPVGDWFESESTDHPVRAFIKRPAVKTSQFAEVADVLERRQARVEPSRIGEQADVLLRGRVEARIRIQPL